MANEKIFDKTKSAADNETTINEKFEELSQGGGGGSITPPTIGDHIGCSNEDTTGGGELITGDSMSAKYQGTFKTSATFGNETKDISIDVGFDVANSIFPSRILTDINSINLIGDVAENHVCVSVDGNNKYYGHEPQMVISGGYAYLAYMYQAKGTGSEEQSTGVSKVRLAKIDISDMSIVSQVIVAEKDDTIEVNSQNKTLQAAGSPNIVIIGSTIRVIMTAWLTDTNANAGFGNHECVIAYRDYNTSLVADEDGLTVCEFVNQDSNTYELTFTNFRAHLENAGDVIQAHCQYAYIKDKYYIAVTNGTSGKNGNIFTTTDFKTFTYWATPSKPSIAENLGLNYEIALFPCKDSADNVLLYFALRRGSNEQTMVVGTMHTGYQYSKPSGSLTFEWSELDTEKEGTTVSARTVPCRGCRPCWFAWGEGVDFLNFYNKNNLYLMYDAVGQDYNQRNYTNVAMLDKFNPSGVGTTIIAQALRMTYPTICYDATNKCYYVAYQARTDDLYYGSYKQLYISKFSPFKATWNRVIPMLRKMLDTFEPTSSNS